MQNDAWERDVKSCVRCAQYVVNIDPRQGYGSRGLQAVPTELRTRVGGLKKDERWRHTCRKCAGAKEECSGLRGDGTQMFKEVPNPMVMAAFDRTAARVRNATGAQAVYEERVRGVLGPPQLAAKFFQKPDTTVWTFGRPKGAEPDPNLLLRGRDGRCVERMLDATGANNVSKLGVHWMKRLTGTAMGKSESPLKAEIVFGDEEKRRLARTPALRKEGFLLEGESIDEVVAG